MVGMVIAAEMIKTGLGWLLATRWQNLVELLGSKIISDDFAFENLELTKTRRPFFLCSPHKYPPKFTTTNNQSRAIGLVVQELKTVRCILPRM